jgi:hypothetical protein
MILPHTIYCLLKTKINIKMLSIFLGEIVYNIEGS